MKMKRLPIFSVFLALLLVFATGCDDSNKPNPKPTPKPTPEVTGMEYDVWIALDEGTSSAAKQDAHAVRRVASLETGEYDIKGKGVETLSSEMTPNAIYHDGYYYSVSRKGDFGKYKITDADVKVVKRFPLKEVLDRRFSHVWLDANTLVLFGSAGDKQVVNWVKINTNDMKVVEKGILDLPAPKKGEQFNSSGLAGYRKSDNVILYTYVYDINKKKAMDAKARKDFNLSVIDAKTMKVVSTSTETRAQMPASTSFGETRQSKAFFDQQGNYYLACNSVNAGSKSTTQQHGYILRVKAGEKEFDKSFIVTLNDNSKIVTIRELMPNVALAYLQNPLYATGKDVWSSKDNPFVFFWSVINLSTVAQTHLKDIPFSAGGNYVELAAVFENYAILGANTKTQTQFYKYDFKSGKITPGAKLKEGYYADRIVPIKK